MIFDKVDISLYRGDELAVFKNESGTDSEKIKKALQSRFSKKETFLITSNFLLIVYSLKEKMKRTMSKNNRTTLFPLLSSNLYLSRNVYAGYLFKR